MRPILFCFHTILLAIALSAPAHAFDGTRAEEVIKPFVDQHQFMGSVLVAEGDEVVFSKSYGTANAEWDIDNTPSTRFRLGSITKQFTAASILLLEEQGKLKTTDPIAKYIPNLPDSWNKITIFNLLTHSSGIFNYTALPEVADIWAKKMSPREILDLVTNKPLDFQPGEEMRYSNTGYVALGLIIETVTKESYAEFVQKNIFTPLGMNNSGYDSNTTIIKHRATGYTNGPNGMVIADYVHMSLPHAAGALYSTTEELLRWNSALYGGKLLKPASLKKMLTPYKENYAFGIGVIDTERGLSYSHNGGIQGFNTFMIYYPKSKISVIALANLNGNAPQTIGSQLAILAHGGDITLTSERKAIELTSSALQKFVGTYTAPATKMQFKITVDNDILYSQLSGQRKLAIYPESELSFFAKAVDAQIEFAQEGDKVSGLTLHQNGRNLNFPRTSDTVDVRQATALPTEELDNFVGTYSLDIGMDLNIQLKDGQLLGQVGNRPTFDLHAESKDLLFSNDVDLFLDVSRDDSGRVTGVTLHIGPQSAVGKRK